MDALANSFTGGGMAWLEDEAKLKEQERYLSIIHFERVALMNLILKYRMADSESVDAATLNQEIWRMLNVMFETFAKIDDDFYRSAAADNIIQPLAEYGQEALAKVFYMFVTEEVVKDSIRSRYNIFD